MPPKYSLCKMFVSFVLVQHQHRWSASAGSSGGSVRGAVRIMVRLTSTSR